MSDLFINEADIIWKKVRYLKKPWQATDEEAKWEMELILPEPLASWDVFSVWEAERYDSMKKHLKKGDILFDCGAEVGWLSVVYANIVGAENLVLFEPTPEFASNIRLTFKHNNLSDPKAFYGGLLSDKTIMPENIDFDIRHRGIWPETAFTGKIIDKMKYRYIHENSHNTPQITIDDYVRQTGIIPNALTIDCEGCDLLILKGAKNTLREYPLKVWVSQHNDLALKNYGIKPGEIETFMEELGYRGDFLAEDHESHFYYCK